MTRKCPHTFFPSYCSQSFWHISDQRSITDQSGNFHFRCHVRKIYKTIILPVVLYGCETWPLTLREECRLRVFDNRVQRRIFGPKRDEVTGEWRKLHEEELNDLCSSPNIIRVIRSRRMKWKEHVVCMGNRRGVYRVLVGKTEGKNHLEDPGIDGKIILKWIFSKWNGGHGLD